MIHEKMAGLMSPAERLARVASAAYRTAASGQTAPSGSVSVTNADGTRTVIGAANASGSTMATHVGDETPPGRPTGVSAVSSGGCVYVGWDGTLLGGVPADFCRLVVWISAGGAEEVVGSLTGPGMVSTPPMPSATEVAVWAAAEDDCCRADGTPAHNVSERGDVLRVRVVQGEDSGAIEELRRAVGLASADATAARSEARAAREAAERATWHFFADSAGAHVSTSKQDATTGANLLLVGNGISLRDGREVVSSFDRSRIELGKNSERSVISLCGGTCLISYDGTLKATKMESDTICLFGGRTTYVGGGRADGKMANVTCNSDADGTTAVKITASRKDVGGAELSVTAADSAVRVSAKRLFVSAASISTAKLAEMLTDTGWVTIHQATIGGVQYFVRYRAVGGVCYMTWDMTGVGESGSYTSSAIPSKYRPDFAMYFPTAVYGSNNTGSVWMPAKGGSGGRPWLSSYDPTARMVGSAAWPYVSQ